MKFTHFSLANYTEPFDFSLFTVDVQLVYISFTDIVITLIRLLKARWDGSRGKILKVFFSFSVEVTKVEKK